jgi:hypothetical protein
VLSLAMMNPRSRQFGLSRSAPALELVVWVNGAAKSSHTVWRDPCCSLAARSIAKFNADRKVFSRTCRILPATGSISLKCRRSRDSDANQRQ